MSDPFHPLDPATASDWSARWTRMRQGVGIGERERLVIGLSGGADSVLLASLVAHARPAVRALAVHVDHGLRGAESDADAEFCARFCRALGLELVRRRIELTAAPLGERDAISGLEARARELRYRALAEEARRFGARTVVVGHHADDSLETLLMRWMRGTDMAGLPAIRARARLWPGIVPEMALASDDDEAPRTFDEDAQRAVDADILASDGEIDLVRPLLSLRREEVRALLRTAGVSWRSDQTNRDARFTRSRVRHALLPQIDATCGPRGIDGLRAFAAAIERLEDELAARTLDLRWSPPIHRHELAPSAGSPSAGSPSAGPSRPAASTDETATDPAATRWASNRGPSGEPRSKAESWPERAPSARPELDRAAHAQDLLRHEVRLDGGHLERAALERLVPLLQRRALWRLLTEGTGHSPSRALLDLLVEDLAEGRRTRRSLPARWSLQLRADGLHLIPPAPAPTTRLDPRARQLDLPFSRSAASGGRSASDRSPFSTTASSKREDRGPRAAPPAAPAPTVGDPLDELHLSLPGVAHLPDGRTITAEIIEVEGDEAVPRHPSEVELDPSADGEEARELIVRWARPGDRFHGLGAPGSRPLRRFLAEAGVPREERDRVPLVFAGHELIWVAGVRPSETRRVEGGLRRRLRLRLIGAPSAARRRDVGSAQGRASGA